MAKDALDELQPAQSATYRPYFETEAVRKVERLSLSEETAKRKEDNLNASSRYKFAHQDELTKIRLGRVMHKNEFLRLLRKIIPAEYNEFSRVGMRGLNVFQNTMKGREKVYVCAVQDGWMPEWSTLREDEYGRPTNQKYRGWRDVLLNLSIKGFVTQRQINKVFGEPDAQGNIYRASLASRS